MVKKFVDRKNIWLRVIGIVELLCLVLLVWFSLSAGGQLSFSPAFLSNSVLSFQPVFSPDELAAPFILLLAVVLLAVLLSPRQHPAPIFLMPLAVCSLTAAGAPSLLFCLGIFYWALVPCLVGRGVRFVYVFSTAAAGYCLLLLLLPAREHLAACFDPAGVSLTLLGPVPFTVVLLLACFALFLAVALLAHCFAGEWRPGMEDSLLPLIIHFIVAAYLLCRLAFSVIDITPWFALIMLFVACVFAGKLVLTRVPRGGEQEIGVRRRYLLVVSAALGLAGVSAGNMDYGLPLFMALAAFFLVLGVYPWRARAYLSSLAIIPVFGLFWGMVHLLGGLRLLHGWYVVVIFLAGFFAFCLAVWNYAFSLFRCPAVNKNTNVLALVWASAWLGVGSFLYPVFSRSLAVAGFSQESYSLAGYLREVFLSVPFVLTVPLALLSFPLAGRLAVGRRRGATGFWAARYARSVRRLRRQVKCQAAAGRKRWRRGIESLSEVRNYCQLFIHRVVLAGKERPDDYHWFVLCLVALSIYLFF